MGECIMYDGAPGNVETNYGFDTAFLNFVPA